jgi:hypothetical protein
MANEFHISAGLIPDDSGDSMAVNTFYISAGLVPDDVTAGGTSLPLKHPFLRTFVGPFGRF